MSFRWDAMDLDQLDAAANVCQRGFGHGCITTNFRLIVATAQGPIRLLSYPHVQLTTLRFLLATLKRAISMFFFYLLPSTTHPRNIGRLCLETLTCVLHPLDSLSFSHETRERL
ncbi:MAG TPA: hypothetical protein PKD64_02430 [Pirellulaceae bacterium]|nr:hypothetical protein [Pirellulaceae bacterium]HMO91025.1 hypothetical protein [Pirellulaceae bacterium]HMP68140.1 hypothetical protein [Pirellulaceae bacterium]